MPADAAAVPTPAAGPPGAAHWIAHVPDWRAAPMAYWVHLEQDGRHWYAADAFEPAAPRALPRRGYPLLCVACGATVLHFSSRAQALAFIEVLSRTPLPTSTRLSRLRPGSAGPNGHWLSRLPAALKSARGRPRAVAAVQAALAAHPGFS